MGSFEGAVDRGDTVVLEVSVLAVDERLAKIRGGVWLIGRHPAEATAVESVRVADVGGGRISEHRVLVELNKDEGLRDLLKIESVKSKLEDMI